MISNSQSVFVPNTRSLSPFNQPKLSVGALAKSKLSLLKYFILFKQEEYPFKMREGSNGSLRSRTYIPLWTLPLPRALNNVGNLRIILSETLMAWREGRGGSEVSDKMPTWGEFYQSLQNPPWKGFVWKRALAMTELATWWPLEPLYLAGKRGLVSLWGRFPLVTVFCRVCKAPLPTTIMLLRLLAISQILFKRSFLFGWVFGKIKVYGFNLQQKGKIFWIWTFSHSDIEPALLTITPSISPISITHLVGRPWSTHFRKVIDVDQVCSDQLLDNFRTIVEHVFFYKVGQETQVVGNCGAGFVLMFPSPSFWSHLLLFLNVAPATKHLPQFPLQNPLISSIWTKIQNTCTKFESHYIS